MWLCLKTKVPHIKVNHYSVFTSTYETESTLKIKLLSGQHLGKDVFVKITVIGHAVDNYSWSSSVKTDFCPVWEEELLLSVRRPEVAVLEFKALTAGSEQLIGSYSVALPMIQKGYRNIRLENYDGTKNAANVFFLFKI